MIYEVLIFMLNLLKFELFFYLVLNRSDCANNSDVVPKIIILPHFTSNTPLIVSPITASWSVQSDYSALIDK